MPLLPFSDASPPTTNASLLTSGTLANARLSSTVSLDNIDNSFTAGQTITAAANTSALTASYSVTGANTTPLLDLSGTWNTTGVARGLKLNITDTASAATSLLMDLQVGGTSRFSVGSPTYGLMIYSSASTDGTTFRLASTATGGKTYQFFSTASGNGSGAGLFGVYNSTDNLFAYACTQSAFGINANSFYGFFPSVNLGNPSGYDVRLYRDAANTLALRNGTSANTLRVYGSFTDSSNGRRLDITSTTAGIFTLTATGNGTGATGNLLKLTQPILLPASSVSLATNGDLAFEATSNTSLTIRYRGSDGTTRSASLILT